MKWYLGKSWDPPDFSVHEFGSQPVLIDFDVYWPELCSDLYSYLNRIVQVS